MRVILFLLLAAVCVAPSVAAENRTRVHALLVIASPQRGEPDPRLAAYAPTLRRILRFEGYRLAGEGSAQLSAPGQAKVNLGRGHALELETESADGKGVRLRIHWQDGGRSLMNTGLTLRAGVPAVLGGPSTGKESEVWAIILVAD